MIKSRQIEDRKHEFWLNGPRSDLLGQSVLPHRMLEESMALSFRSGSEYQHG